MYLFEESHDTGLENLLKQRLIHLEFFFNNLFVEIDHKKISSLDYKSLHTYFISFLKGKTNT